MRLAGSSDANPFACVAAGIASLWGPMHGGANEAVIQMLREIGTADRIPEYLAKAKDKQDAFKLMGFGHRVYRNLDPRAKEMRVLAIRCIAEFEKASAAAADADAYLTSSAPVGAVSVDDVRFDGAELRMLFELATALETAALKDDYFVSRKLFPNVDYYSGLALCAIGIPLSMFTPMFAIGRSIGWIAQWKESIEEPVRKIGRPRQLYTGEPPRSYVPIGERGGLGPSATAIHRETSFTDKLSPVQMHGEDAFGYFT